MDTTIEKLQSESNEIRVALESLQKQAQNTETEKKKQELVAQAEEAKKQAETLLQTETDENTKAQLEEIKKQLENYASELQALRIEVKEQAQSTNQQETTASSNENSSAASPSSAPEKEKNFLQKGIDWIKGDEKETHHTAKAIGRGALVASGIGLGVYGLGKLF